MAPAPLAGALALPSSLAETKAEASQPTKRLCGAAASAQRPSAVEAIHFNLLSAKDVMHISELAVSERNLYDMPDRVPRPAGLLDPRLGTSDKTIKCATCGGALKDCAGHFGHIKLELPVFHIGYFKHTLGVLQCICKRCSRVLLTDEERNLLLRRLRSRQTDLGVKRAISRRVSEKCKRVRNCPHCGAHNGPVRKVANALKIQHDKHSKAPKELLDEETKCFETLLKEEDANSNKQNDSIARTVKASMDDLNPLRTLRLFERIPFEDVVLLDVSGGRPEHLLLTHLPVSPVCIRPSVNVDNTSGTNEDDITMKMVSIVEVNNRLKQDIERGIATSTLVECWDHLQTQCASLVNSELPGLPSTFHTYGSKPNRGFAQRLKGKQGRFRFNLSGKRVDFTGRTVISPDPNLSIDQVGVPLSVATSLTYPEMVNEYNIHRLRRCVRNGMHKHPGANFIEKVQSRDAEGSASDMTVSGGKSARGDKAGKWYLKYGDSNKAAQQLQIGDVVERHLMDGDVVLFNRQPSLHRLSIMAHRVRVHKHRTFSFNLCVCAPYNADFDGDEMNLHVPQTEAAKAEARMLMGVHHNLRTPKGGEALVACTQDFLTSAFLLTSRDVFFDRTGFNQVCCMFSNTEARECIEVPPPAIWRPIALWTGKQVVSALIRSCRIPSMGKAEVRPSFEVSEKGYSRKAFGVEREAKELCPSDGWVCVHKGELVSGRMGKATLGSGTRTGLFATLLATYEPLVAAGAMDKLARLSSRWIGSRGFSIGLDDVKAPDALIQGRRQRMEAGYARCDAHIEEFRRGNLQLQAGCTMDETLEAVVTGELNNIRQEAGALCSKLLSRLNPAVVMATCGSKGSPLNVAQMVACVGQQTVSGQRCPDGFDGRTLPHYEVGARDPASKGFVANSFFSGLTPTELFFHAMGGREGLVDTAVKTAETGYMSRRLMKALEDLGVQYDGTVRTSTKHIVQFQYGDDGLDPMLMVGKDGVPVDFAEQLASVLEEDRSGAPGETHGVGLDRWADDRDARKSDVEALIASLDNELFPHGLTDQDGKQLDPLGEQGSKGGGKDMRARPSKKFSDELRAFLKSAVVDSRDGLVPSPRQLALLGERSLALYRAAAVDPGTAVGAVGAQSIGEPGTQMTLKTFHFAGVASMNVTLGVPRIKEIVNASKNIATPIMTVALVCQDDEISARVVKGRVERTTLGEVSKSIRIILKPDTCQVQVELEMETIRKLQLDIDAYKVERAILKSPRLRLKQKHVTVVPPLKGSTHATRLFVSPPEPKDSKTDKDDDDKQSIFITVQRLHDQLKDVVVAGVAQVNRAVINREDGKRFNMLVEGTDLLQVMTIDGVDGLHTRSNHIFEMEKVLGIEAARQSIHTEIDTTMKHHGMSIDPRHPALLAEIMTVRGEVNGITRFGIAKLRDSVLMLASFEKTTDHLFDAAARGRCDEILGVSECIIMGTAMPLGTGAVRLYHKLEENGKGETAMKRKLGKSLYLDDAEDYSDDDNATAVPLDAGDPLKDTLLIPPL